MIRSKLFNRGHDETEVVRLASNTGCILHGMVCLGGYVGSYKCSTASPGTRGWSKITPDHWRCLVRYRQAYVEGEQNPVSTERLLLRFCAIMSRRFPFLSIEHHCLLQPTKAESKTRNEWVRSARSDDDDAPQQGNFACIDTLPAGKIVFACRGRP